MNPLPVLGSLFAPTFHGLRRARSSLLGGADAIELCLHQSGSHQKLDQFRSSKLVWALVGLAAAGVGAIRPPLTGPSCENAPAETGPRTPSERTCLV